MYSKVNWKYAPKEAIWWAIDEDGFANWFCPPDVARNTNFWYSAPIPAPTFGYAGDWRESLSMRYEVVDSKNLLNESNSNTEFSK